VETKIVASDRTKARRASRHANGLARGFGAALVLAIGLVLPSIASAALYKWVDDKGVVHYSDKMPPESASKASVQLSSQGIPIKKVDAVATAEQRKAKEAELQQQRDARQQQEETARRNKALLDSYTVENDIDLARDRATRTVQVALQSALSYSAQLMRRRAAIMERRASYAGKPVPIEIERELASIDEEVGRQGEIIAQKNRQLVEIQAKYDADKERWHAINGPKTGSKPTPVTGATVTTMAVPAATPTAAAPAALSPSALPAVTAGARSKP
jgi:hypothetical protein